MSITSIDIKEILEATTSLGLAGGVNLFVGKEPDMPDSCITIFDYSGAGADDVVNVPDEIFENTNFQLRVRGDNFVTVTELADKLVDTLHQRANEAVNGTTYALIKCVSVPSLLDWDEKNRVRFIINFRTLRERSTT